MHAGLGIGLGVGPRGGVEWRPAATVATAPPHLVQPLAEGAGDGARQAAAAQQGEREEQEQRRQRGGGRDARAVGLRGGGREVRERGARGASGEAVEDGGGEQPRPTGGRLAAVDLVRVRVRVG